jgi:hypothetical protein
MLLGAAIVLRLEKAVQHLDVERISPLSVVSSNIAMGFPEVFSAEITHPVRDRVRPSNDVELAPIALWAQHGRGPITETIKISTGEDGFAPGTLVVVTKFKIYLNDAGPIEVLADDHFTVKITETVNNATYNIYAPEQPLVLSEANKYYEYETALILATDRERRISTLGKLAIILPNNAGIKRVITRSKAADGSRSEEELTVYELMRVQAEVNPYIASADISGTTFDDRRTLALHSGDGDLFLMMFHDVESIQLDVELGTELKYTLISLLDRI